ncbi:unnamed protein product [Calypogeia fissa]
MAKTSDSEEDLQLKHVAELISDMNEIMAKYDKMADCIDRRLAASRQERRKRKRTQSDTLIGPKNKFDALFDYSKVAPKLGHSDDDSADDDEDSSLLKKCRLASRNGGVVDSLKNPASSAAGTVKSAASQTKDKEDADNYDEDEEEADGYDEDEDEEEADDYDEDEDEEEADDYDEDEDEIEEDNHENGGKRDSLKLDHGGSMSKHRAFVLFSLDERPNAIKSHPAYCCVSYISKILRDMWSKMSEEEKAPYDAKMRENKEMVKQHILTHGADAKYVLDSSTDEGLSDQEQDVKKI